MIELLKMIELQKLREWAIAEKEKALVDYEIYNDGGDTPRWAGDAAGKAKAFSAMIEKLDLLLKKTREQQP